MVLQNDVVFGTVNANRAHYQAAAGALAKADRGLDFAPRAARALARSARAPARRH
jgi:hypothetical protein